MKSFILEVTFEKLLPSIKNTAAHYEEGRNILIYCLAKNADRTEQEVVQWLKSNKIPIKDLKKYKIKDGSGRSK